MKKRGCGMVVYEGKVVVLGGIGPRPPGPIPPGVEFVESSTGRIFTNELHTFDLEEGEEV